MFKKSDIIDGDVIQRRCGSVEICLPSLGVLITGDDGWNDMNDITDDLRYTSERYGWVDQEYDIVAVRRPVRKEDCILEAFSLNKGALVYSRT